MNALRQAWNGFAAWCACRTGEGQLDRALRLIAAAIVLWFPAACLLVNRSDSASLIFLGVIGLSVWVRSGFRAGLSRRDWLFVGVFVAFFLVGVLSFQFGTKTDEGFRLLGRYIRFLFALPVLLALRRYPPPAPAVWAGLGIAALLLGLDAVWESMAAGGFLRPDGDTNVAILFGDLATLTTFVFAAGYLYIDGQLTRTGPILVAVCVLMGLLASFLSDTRGAWVAVPVLLVLFLSCRHMLRPRVVLASGILILVLFGLLLLAPHSRVRQRIENISLQIKAYQAITSGVGRDAAPQCLDNAQALHAWINTDIGDYPSGFTMDVEPVQGADARALKGNGCNRAVALHFHNSSKDVGWAQFYRYEYSDNSPATTRLMVKGHAWVKFGLQVGGAMRVGTRTFGRMEMLAPPHEGYALRVILEPGDDFWLLPIESYFGEYRYAVLSDPVGQRLAMWSVALRLFRDSPIFGVGTGAYQVKTRDLVASGSAPPNTADFDHPHSDYFDALSSRGLLGFLVLVLLLGVPAWLCKRGLESHDRHRLGAALGGVLVATGFAIFGLTETMFIHSVTIGWYAVMTTVFFVCADVREGREN